ncbi:glycosyltransferase family 4 protein [Timonella senegalensis]|uniref:glycosyltransferase family 4 protein n=1 Tax=Timonella senegalensis TaxID=1465825 RepID=UPI0002D53D17|nr:glycosyltransferase family 4 protein [Timonella senegalensis]
MRIIQVLGSSAGGVAQHVAQISELLVEDGQDVMIASPSQLRDKFTPIARHAAVEILDRPRASDAGVVGQLRELAKNADVVHAHGLRAAALVGMAVKSIPGAKRPRFVVTLHNLPVGSWKVQSVTAILERVVAKSADAVLGVSLDIVERMDGLGAKTFGRALVPAPPRGNVSAPRAQLRSHICDDIAGWSADSPLVLTVARLAPQKGLDTLVRAAALASKQAPTMHWIVAGDGPLREGLQKQIDTLGAPVTLLGRRSDVPDLLEAADLVVNAAVWEGQPIAVQEALRAGRAIVATDAGGTSEVTGDAAVLVPVGDESIMADAVAAVLTNQERMATLEAKSRAQSEELPGAAQVLAFLKDVYEG